MDHVLTEPTGIGLRHGADPSSSANQRIDDALALALKPGLKVVS
jgi:hypothetical protein